MGSMVRLIGEFMVAVKKSEIMFTRVKLPGPLSKCWQTQVHQKGP